MPESGQAADEPDEEVSGGTERRWPLASVAVLLLGLAALAMRRSRRTPLPVGAGPPGRIVRAQRALLLAAARLGLGRRPSETFGELTDRWAVEGRVDERADRLATLTAAAAFGGPVDDREAREAERLCKELVELLRASVPTRRRLLAPVRLPLEEAVRVVRGSLDALGRRRRRA